MIVSAAIVPHSPLLVPSVGKEHREKLALTIQAYEALEQSIYLTKPDTFVIISPHAHMYPDAFSGNMANAFKGVLKEFGDHGTSVDAKVDFLMLDHIHRHMREEKIPFTLTSQEEIDYGYTVPLLFLTPHLKTWKLVPLAPSLLDAKHHEDYGKELMRVIHAETSRVAIIASADLSHHANQFSPHGVTPEGEQFNTLVRDYANKRDVANLLAMDPALVEKADQCGYRPILMLLGALEEINCKATELAYEAPFGVGYLTMKYEMA